MKENKKRIIKLRGEFKELMKKYDLDEDTLNKSIHWDEEGRLDSEEWLAAEQEI